jgi:hypothetical protein
VNPLSDDRSFRLEIAEDRSMLFHVSIEAADPRRVAGVLAEIFGGAAAPFPPVADGSWVALAGDERGTMIEVYPLGTELHSGEGGAFGVQGARRRSNGVHLAMATDLDIHRVYAIADREGWPVQYCRRGPFGVIEIWVEGFQMIEVLTPEMQQEYLDSISIDKWKAMVEQAPQLAQAA